MRIIKYKPSDSVEFEKFIDIGSCEIDYYFINFYLPGESENKSGKLYFGSYNSWYENFKKEPIGSKMIIVYYYLSEYLGWSQGENSPQKDYFADVYGDKTLSVISENLNYLLSFHDQWFYPQSSLFKGLDLALDDIEDSILYTKENKDGIISEIQFEDGSCIKFLDENDSIKSFYVLDDDYKELNNAIERIVKMFE